MDERKEEYRSTLLATGRRKGKRELIANDK
jgi:hypothetical protein